jgi:RNA polymerase sigma-70 factor (ECF subfamily)
VNQGGFPVAGDDRLPEELLPRCREYLCLLARCRQGPRLQAKLDASDLVQQTLLKAHEKKDQFWGCSQAELMGWLRQVLANELTAALRKFGTEARPGSRVFSPGRPR